MDAVTGSPSLRKVAVVLLAGIMAVLAGLSAPGTAAIGPAASQVTIYTGGNIITMEGDRPTYAEALVVGADGTIAFVGRRKDALARYPGSKLEDLKGRTMLPGFIDGHSHLYNTGFFALMANLYPPPDGPGQSHASLVTTMQAWTSSAQGKLVIGKYGWIMGFGYDDSLLAEREHPTAKELDRISTELPVVVIHQSGHLASINTKAMQLMGITRDTPDPAGGVIRRNPDGSPSGVLEEAAWVNVGFKIIAKTDAEVRMASLAKAQEQYARYGYSTLQEGRASPIESGALAEASQNGGLYLDVVSYPDFQFGVAAMASPFYTRDRSYRGHYRIGGAKLSLDGSPQGKTAWLSHPYHVPPHDRGADYAGYPALPDAQAQALVAKAYANGWQLLVHANGDAAIDQMITAVSAADKAYPGTDRRTVLIHGQTLRKDQVPQLAKLGILPSLFPAHTFYWGDWHRKSVLGADRARDISPGRWALDAGLTMTSHSDAPVVPPNSLRILDATVNRTTRSGFVLGADQRLTPYEALKTLTAWAAFQYFEEDRKGTLSVGKLADLVILDRNPLTIAPARLHTIRVLRTIKQGKTVWTAQVR